MLATYNLMSFDAFVLKCLKNLNCLNIELKNVTQWLTQSWVKHPSIFFRVTVVI